jgi:DNA-binding XRE family transcriptional regulator
MRTGRKLSRKTVANAVGVSDDYIYKIESGLRVPSIDLTLKIGHYFDVNPEWLKSMWVRDFMTVIEARLSEHIEHIHYLP